MGRKKAPTRSPEQIERDEFLRVTHLLSAAFGTLTYYETWADTPKFAQLPPGADSHCYDCLTPHRASLYPRCGWCGTKAG